VFFGTAHLRVACRNSIKTEKAVHDLVSCCVWLSVAFLRKMNSEVVKLTDLQTLQLETQKLLYEVKEATKRKQQSPFKGLRHFDLHLKINMVL
jgi:hypothetical protein